MKQYTEPEVEINAFAVEDVITASIIPPEAEDNGGGTSREPGGVF